MTMWLRLNILNDGSCAYLYATDADDVKHFFMPKSSQRVVRIWHNDESHSLIRSYADDSPIQIPHNTVNDQYIDFKSEVAFDYFCDEFEKSEYNDPNTYHLLGHNCSHAAYFALNLAGIPVIGNKFFLGKVHEHSTLHLPMVLTPQTLFMWALNYKTQEKYTQSPGTILHQQIKSAARFFRERGASYPRIQEVTGRLTFNAEQTITQYPHHADSVLIALKQGMKLFTSDSPQKHADKLQKLSKSFYLRERPLADQWLTRRLDYLNAIFFATVIECATVFIDPWLFTMLLAWLLFLQFLECLLTRSGPDFFASSKRITPFSEVLQEVVSLMKDGSELGVEAHIGDKLSEMSPVYQSGSR